jgi:hypothetical protein
MSYDLILEAGKGKRLDKKLFSAHFKSRRWYQVGGGQAVYQNEDTGVYFIFDEPADSAVAFNLNYYRPHSFGLEAAMELEAFAEAFNAIATDESGEPAPFNREAFLQAWNDGNRFGYRAMVKEQDKPPHTWPSKRIREVWEWNYARPSEEEQETATVFVPGIFAIDVDGQTFSVAIWPPQCPILMPTVDSVLVPLAQTGKQSEELAMVPWDQILPIVKPYQEKAPGLARYRLEFEEWPSEIEKFLSTKRRAAGQLNGIGMDEVLDRELVEEASRK